MATVRNTIILRDKMSAAVYRIAKSISALNSSVLKTGKNISVYIGGGAAEAAEQMNGVGAAAEKAGRKLVRSMGSGASQVAKGLDGVAIAAYRTSRKISEDIGGGAQQAAKHVNVLGTAASNTGKRIGDGIGGGAEKAARQTQKSMNNAKGFVNSLSSTISGKLAAALVTVSASVYLLQNAFAGIKGVTDTADEFSSINARISGILTEGQTLAEVQNDIYAAAERSRGSYNAMASSVAKIGLLAKDAFNGTGEAIHFSELLQKSFTISGSGLQEQQAGIYQITQALGAGKLQGDEFRSVLENAPLYAQAIAKYMGKTTGELKDMSSQGVITADIMKNAMFGAAEEINRRFEGIPFTFGQAWQVAKDKALRALQPIFARMTEWLNAGGADQMTNVLVTLANAFIDVGNGILWVIDNYDKIEPYVVAATVAFVSFKLAIGAVTAAMWLASLASTAASISFAIATGGATAFFTTLAIATGGLLLIAVAIGAIIMSIYNWVQAVGGIKNAWAIAIDAIITWWDGLKISFIELTSFLLNAAQGLASQVRTFFEDMVNGAISGINKLIGKANQIPGVKIETINEIHGATNFANQAWADKASRAAYVAKLQTEADESTKQRQLLREHHARIAEAKKNSAADAAKDSANKNDGLYKPKPYAGVQGGLNGPKGTANDPLNTKMQGEVTISEEDLKYMRDLARVQFINKITTLRPTVSATFGDVRETADVNQIIGAIAGIVEESTASALS